MASDENHILINSDQVNVCRGCLISKLIVDIMGLCECFGVAGGLSHGNCVAVSGRPPRPKFYL